MAPSSAEKEKRRSRSRSKSKSKSKSKSVKERGASGSDSDLDLDPEKEKPRARRQGSGSGSGSKPRSSRQSSSKLESKHKSKKKEPAAESFRKGKKGEDDDDLEAGHGRQAHKQTSERAPSAPSPHEARHRVVAGLSACLVMTWIFGAEAICLLGQGCPMFGHASVHGNATALLFASAFVVVALVVPGVMYSTATEDARSVRFTAAAMLATSAYLFVMAVVLFAADDDDFGLSRKPQGMVFLTAASVAVGLGLYCLLFARALVAQPATLAKIQRGLLERKPNANDDDDDEIDL